MRSRWLGIGVYRSHPFPTTQKGIYNIESSDLLDRSSVASSETRSSPSDALLRISASAGSPASAVDWSSRPSCKRRRWSGFNPAKGFPSVPLAPSPTRGIGKPSHYGGPGRSCRRHLLCSRRSRELLRPTYPSLEAWRISRARSCSGTESSDHRDRSSVPSSEKRASPSDVLLRISA